MESKTDKVAAQPAAATMTTPTPPPGPAPRRLHPAAIRLVAVAILLCGWLAYLAYLVVRMPHTATGEPLILSRPQFLVSQLDVIAEVDAREDGNGPSPEVTIKEVLYPKADGPVKAGEKVHVVGLKECRRPPHEGEKASDVPSDWTGPGLYLLPLQQENADTYAVVPTPPSPGYHPPRGKEGPPRLYPATEAAKAEYRILTKP
jgi:hypothetical protein